jgi:hypothetical protein
MAELDRFEARLATAYRRYLAEAPVEVDAVGVARQVAAGAPRRHPLAGFRSFGLSPALAWALLLLAALLAALVGEMLLAGSQTQRKLPAVVPPIGQVFACPPGSTPDKPGPVDQVRPPFSSGLWAFDRRAGRIVRVAPTTAEEAPGVATWTFDVCANTWTRMQPNREPPSFDGVWLVYDVDSDVTIGVSPDGATPGRVWAYDLQANTWTEKGGAPAGAWLSGYDSVSGLVVAASFGDPMKLWTYDVETDTWTPIQQANAGPGGSWSSVIAYDASVDRVVAYARFGGYPLHETWLFDVRTGTWSRSVASTPHVSDWLAPEPIAYDEAARRTVVGGNGRLAAYDAAADRWETIEPPAPEYPDPGAWHGVSIVDDPVNARLVVLPDTWGSRSTGTDDGVVAFDLVTHEWTVLLDPGKGQQPASTPPTRPAPMSAQTPAPSGGTEESGLTSPVPTAFPTSTP